jgi:2,4-dienoyl-CoA reductase (NADPH2)
VSPRNPRIKGQDEGIARGQVLSYVDVLLRGKRVGKRVAVVGAGGIGFDVAEIPRTRRPFALARHRGRG